MTSDNEDTTMGEADDSTKEAKSINLMSPPGRSPPGMSLRSGRKKRRRSKETTGLTPPDGTPAKRKRTGLEDDDDDSEDDESMEDTEQAASEAAAAAITESNTAKKKPEKRLEPIQKLRMPSQHTPGQTKKKKASASATTVTATAPIATTATTTAAASLSATVGAPPAASSSLAGGTRKLLFDAAASSTPASEELQDILAHPPPPPKESSRKTPEGRHDALPKNLVRRTSDVLMDFTSNIQEVTTHLVVPQAERMHLQDKPLVSSMPPLDRTWVWIGILFLVQLLVWVCAFPLGSNPIGGAVVALSDMGMGVYHGSHKSTEPVPEMVDPTVDLTRTSVGEENRLEPLLESVVVSMESAKDNTTMMNLQLDEVQKTLKNRNSHFKHLQMQIEKTERAVANVLKTMSEKSQKWDVRGARQLLEKLESKLENTKFHFILDFSAVPLWDVAPVPCSSASPTTQDAILTFEELELQDQDLRRRAHDAANLFKTDPDLSASIKQWVREQVKKVLAQSKHRGGGSDEKSLTNVGDGLTVDDVQSVIQSRLERQVADQLGRVDYALLATGASIVTSGPRATSPSLVDNLPLVNRLAAHWRLRFYGHGPEAALSPTLPLDALGQCWSFEAQKTSNKDDSRGEFGTLTVQLSKPVAVTSVVVEHVPKELTRQVKSAVRQFRVIGYEDAQAMGKPWFLGSFEYNVNRERALQEWETETETKDGTPIPKLGSVTLAIDTNHGFDYTCLYRFRVHGDP